MESTALISLTFSGCICFLIHFVMRLMNAVRMMRYVDYLTHALIRQQVDTNAPVRTDMSSQIMQKHVKVCYWFY